jgi:hypothetical protein
MEVGPIDHAPATPAFGILRVLAEIFTVDTATADEPFQGFQGQLAARVDAAGVDAILVDLGRVDPVEPVCGAADRQRVGVAGMAGCEGEEEKGDCQQESHRDHHGN